MRYSLAAGALGIMFAIVSAQAGCSVIVDSSPRQCSTDTDCRDRGPAFVDSFCGRDGLCTRAVDYCATNGECIDRLGSEAAICRKDSHRCVTLATRYCTLLADKDDLRNDEVLIIGSHGVPSWSAQTAAGPPALELVRRDLKSTQGGLPASSTSNGALRPVVFLSCDVPIGQQGVHKEVTDHLFETVGVPVSLGPFATVEMTTYGLQKAITTGTVLLTVAEDQLAFQVPGRDERFFVFGYPVGGVVTSYVEGVKFVEKNIRDRTGSVDPIKVAFVYVSTGAAETEARQMYEQIRFNDGKTAEANGALYREFTYTPPTADPNFLENISNVSLAVKDFGADMVVLRGADEILELGKLIETAMPGKAHFLMSIEAQGLVVSWVGTNEDLRKRIMGVRPGRYEKDPRVVRAQQRFRAAGFEEEPSPLTTAYLDMSYAVLFAAAAVTNEPLTGASLGRALKHRFKPGGIALEASPSSILRGFAAAQAGQDIYLQGNEADVLWDPAQVNLDWKVQYWCIHPDVNLNRRVVDTGAGYNGATKTVSGDVPDCSKIE